MLPYIVYFNLRSLCGARRHDSGGKRGGNQISIHSPRAGRDGFGSVDSPRYLLFQSTRPVWGETHQYLRKQASNNHFNPLAPRGARPSDSALFVVPSSFQSNRPVWGETVAPEIQFRLVHVISIHSPRVGRDGAWPGGLSVEQYFNPLAPRGARLVGQGKASSIWAFQSTRPAWGETTAFCVSKVKFSFQSTRPAWGETKNTAGEITDVLFQSTRPVRGETHGVPSKHNTGQRISIHSPRVGRDSKSVQVILLWFVHF